MKYLIFLSLLLVACGQSEKQKIDFGTGGDEQREACAAPSFFQPGLTPISDPATLPKGTYRLTFTEAYFREEGGELRAHFMEGERGDGEFISRKVCASDLPARALLSIEYPAFSEFTVSDASTYRPASSFILGEKEKISFSRMPAGAVETGSILAVLSRWSNWNMYKLSESEYEMRLYVFEALDSRQILKLMTMRFSFVPSSQ